MSNRPNPAIVAQSAVRQLPRWALLLCCVAYVVPGFVGRGPWKNADLAAFGYMLELADGRTNWLHPLLGGMAPESNGLLPYWLGAWAMVLLPPDVLAPELAARLPFVALLAFTLAACWYGVYYLALDRRAQPVAFAFGGEAQPRDYARAVADGGLLALIACLGLAQLAHEATAHLTQLAFATFTFFAAAAAPYRPPRAALALAGGLAGLTLSGAPAIALLLGCGSALLALLEGWQAPRQALLLPDGDQTPTARRQHWRWAAFCVVATVAAALLGAAAEVWEWRLATPAGNGRSWVSLGRLLLWFTWPTWPLALWTVWRWRRQLAAPVLHRHLATPAWFIAVALGATLTTEPADRALLIALPSLAALAAFALPTLRRSVAALIDWFTLLFFSGSALIVWVVYVAMQTGWPRQPAANVARLAPGFTPRFSAVALVVALAATLAWAWLVRWRIGRHQRALWKSVVLPAGGSTLCWLLLMTLWLPLLDYARSYAPQVHEVVRAMDGTPPDVPGAAGCLVYDGFSRAQVAAYQYHGALQLQPLHDDADGRCPWLAMNAGDVARLAATGALADWRADVAIPRPADRNDTVQLFRRRAP